jgi:hypothetical protein
VASFLASDPSLQVDLQRGASRGPSPHRAIAWSCFSVGGCGVLLSWKHCLMLGRCIRHFPSRADVIRTAGTARLPLSFWATVVLFYPARRPARSSHCSLIGGPPGMRRVRRLQENHLAPLATRAAWCDQQEKCRRRQIDATALTPIRCAPPVLRYVLLR